MAVKNIPGSGTGQAHKKIAHKREDRDPLDIHQ
jgi:hypothetical protein